jgi:AraC-like DNA-binding protein
MPIFLCFLLHQCAAYFVKAFVSVFHSVTEIGFASGFNSFAHFIATFTKRYKLSLSKARA